MPPAATASPPPTASPAPETATPGRRAVVYRSSALDAAAPDLVAAVPPEKLKDNPLIKKANSIADEVRAEYKRTHRKHMAEDSDGETMDATADTDDPLLTVQAKHAKKYERRLKGNRTSAAASRIRREAYTKALESLLIGQGEKNREHEARMAALVEENERLKKRRRIEENMSDSVRKQPRLDYRAPAVVAQHSHSFAPDMNAHAVFESPEVVSDPIPVSSETALPVADVLQPFQLVPEELMKVLLACTQQVPDVEPAVVPFDPAFGETDPEDPCEALDQLLNLPTDEHGT